MPHQYILSAPQANLKIARMVLEIAENNTDTQRMVLVGIVPNGSIIADKVAQLLPQYFSGTIERINLELDKRHPTTIVLDAPLHLEGAALIVIDDVSNSGKTLTYALKPFLDHHPTKIQTLVLVARTHKRFPIQPDYVGLALATTLQEYIDVEIIDGEVGGVWMA
ncbi:MAG: phosphoribosyltransferase [Bacteroidetes bacterium]|nr:MAG: phosphoribosyltransferase [Bacteroidota bacterium]